MWIYICMYIYIYVCVYELPSKSIVDVWYENIGYRFFLGGLSFYSALFKSILKNAKIQRNHGFRSLNCRGWIKGSLVVFAFATILKIYLSTFLDSFLSK